MLAFEYNHVRLIDVIAICWLKSVVHKCTYDKSINDIMSMIPNTHMLTIQYNL